ncbi:MAG TPA: bifunctional oligoribonuclease/PAP phosphatase NrnA [Candidatus Gemmiger excrementipullorum]|uniref:Bifunctional oligoribonuclease/PAP phosphatase NrnA n=1 Tax=Candidatus Gemmiger excrementipullorum TaxID=2838610 RepID=A0A9D1Y072_9FIRM|nr:bifunctional oligoribonuclease/PAP phosphatase NrnA [Candidatus Gemmiger excrementipullorum]
MTQSVDHETVVSRLLGADDILILCHKNPDGDTLGSGAALCLALRRLGKTAAVLCSDPIPAMYAFLPITVFDGSFAPRFVVAVDVAGIQLFGDKNNMPRYAEHVDLCIDHHASNSGYAYESLVDGSAAAAAELLTSLIPELGVELTPDIAACLYTGLATDTGCFRFTNTTAATHRAAARLIEAGADVATLNERLFECRSHARMEAERMALESLEYYYGDRCAMICLTWDQIQAAGVAGAELEDLTSLPRSIEGVEVGLTLRQQKDGSYKISVRTGNQTNACSIARRLGGGGHPRAAGCEISGNLDNAKHAILDEVKKELDRAAQAAEPDA